VDAVASETVWDGYRVIELPFGPVPPRELTRAQARQFFAAMMNMREERIAQLRGLVARNGFPVESEAAFRVSVVDFINAHAELDDTPIDIGHDLGDFAYMLLPPRPIWQAVALDVGFLLGSAIVEAVPTLRWELLTKGGKLRQGYHFPVLSGFERGEWPNFHMSPLTLSEQLVGGAAAGTPMESIDHWIDVARTSA
jgi:hypothetical protein